MDVSNPGPVETWIISKLPTWIVGTGTFLIALLLRREGKRIDGYDERLVKIESDRVRREDFQRLENKVDKILLRRE